ncbi:MAG: SOS response-associated peptidase family protein [Caulobacter sp.]|nr:SOS response-associated peptidase family protein [Caulobacter sp.]
MCNTFLSPNNPKRVEWAFSQVRIPLIWPEAPMPNRGVTGDIRPTDPACVVVPEADGGRLCWMAWGFPRDRGGPLINFRSEGRRFSRVGRCLVMVNGFYETTDPVQPGQKRKDWWLFQAPEVEIFALAGHVRDDRFTLLTCEPGPDVAPIHDRQPVALMPDQWRDWLAGAPESGLIAPSPAGTFSVAKRET